MAARKVHKKLDDAWREKIKASQMINRLNNHALGKNQMTASQIRAAEILLRKVIPDLKSVEHKGDTGTKVIIKNFTRGA